MVGFQVNVRALLLLGEVQQREDDERQRRRSNFIASPPLTSIARPPGRQDLLFAADWDPFGA